MLSGQSHSCCSRGAGPLPSLPLPPLVQTKCCTGDTQRPSLEKFCPSHPCRIDPDTQHLAPLHSSSLFQELRAASEDSCHPCWPGLSARGSAQAPGSTQHDRFEQEIAHTGARVQHQRAGPSGRGYCCPVRGADRGLGLPPPPWIGVGVNRLSPGGPSGQDTPDLHPHRGCCPLEAGWQSGTVLALPGTSSHCPWEWDASTGKDDVGPRGEQRE